MLCPCYFVLFDVVCFCVLYYDFEFAVMLCYVVLLFSVAPWPGFSVHDCWRQMPLVCTVASEGGVSFWLEN